MVSYALLVVGFAMLVFGGDWLVKGAVAIAERLRIPPIIIGLTIVAFGTSTPELVISVDAALVGSGGIAVGNVIGSNIANILLVLGVPALISPILCRQIGTKRALTVLFAITLLFMVFLQRAPIGFASGFTLLICLGLFLGQQIVHARSRHVAIPTTDYHDELGAIPQSNGKIILFIALGLVALPFGAWLTVNSAINIATNWQVSEEVIGLTVVAIGTSLPELAAAVMAARHNANSILLGSVIGSNLFNIAAVIAIAAMVRPLEVSQHLVLLDMWMMLLVLLMLIFCAVAHIRIGKIMGSGMLVLYGWYIVFTVIQ